MSREPIGFAIIGAGTIGPTHAEAIDKAPEARLVAVCDVVEEKARTLAEKYGAASVTDIAEVLTRDEVQAVCVCVPSGLHGDVVIRAAEAGKHILCEKPLDINLRRIDEMIQAADENHVRLAGVFQSRTAPTSLKLREAVRSGKLGKLVLGDCYQKWYRAHEYYASAGWRATWELDGGGCLMNQGVHGIDLISWIMGRAARVNAHCRHLTRNIPVEDTAVATVEWECGALGVIQGTTSNWPGLNTRLEVSGDNGTIVLDGGEFAKWEIRGEEAQEAGEAGDTASADPTAISATGHQAHVEDLCAAIYENRPPMITGRDARHAVEIIKAIYLSSRSGGATVELPLSYEDDGPGIYPPLGSPRLEW
ncbi:MAG TPA: Gfo/Idh/MocA family oxidoreductase [Armatimonadota bacterium]|jgi:predicted dehydrogenase